MDKQYIEQFDIGRKYLKNELTPEEVIQFEEYLLDKPELIEQLELDRIAMLAMPKVSQQREQRSLWRWWKPTYSHGMALVASVCLVAVLVFSPQRYEQRVGNSPDIIFIEVMRGAIDSAGANSEALVNKASSGQVLIFDVSRFEPSSYSLSLLDDKGNQVMQWDNLQSNENGELVLQTSLQSSAKSDFSLVLTPGSNDELLMKTRITVE